MKNVLIIGAGVAGPVLAVGLLRAGLSPLVVEAYPEGTALDTGAWLTLAVNGLEALRAFDLHREVLAVGFPTPSVELRNGAGRILGTVPLGGTLPDGTVTQSLRRADLYRALVAQAAAAGVPFAYGQRLVHAEDLADGTVLARFADGSERRADALIGADGVHSVVRGLMDPRAPVPRATGMGNVGGFVRGVPVDLPVGQHRMIFGRRAFFGFTVHPSGEVWWFANPPVPYPPEPDAEWLAGLFAEDDGPAAALIRATPGPLRFLPQHELPRVPVWRRGAIGIVGDAAHVASPTSGQGASLAAEDGVVLARLLRDHPVPEALAAFEGERRARVERVVREAAQMSSHKVPGRLGAWARDLALPAILRRVAADPRDWLFTHRVGWER